MEEKDKIPAGKMELPGADVQRILELTDRLAEQKKIDTDKHWQELSGRIRKEERKVRFLHVVRTAAAVLFLPVLLLSGLLFMQLRDWQAQPVEQVELLTAYGVVSKVTLSDGSEVWLNSGSKLVYPKRFTGDERQVSLVGEAYFKVKSNPSRRFDVQTAEGVTVSAYGTEFNVQAYDDDTCVVATLADGNICVEQSALHLEEDLKPGEQAVFSKRDGKMNRQQANLLVEMAWREGKIVFRRTPMEEVAKVLSRHFNVDIRLQGKEVFDYAYSGTFTIETITEILSLLEKSAPISCEIMEPEQQSDYTFSRKKVLIRLRN